MEEVVTLLLTDYTNGLAALIMSENRSCDRACTVFFCQRYQAFCCFQLGYEQIQLQQRAEQNFPLNNLLLVQYSYIRELENFFAEDVAALLLQ